jgi:hypothetical protein
VLLLLLLLLLWLQCCLVGCCVAVVASVVVWLLLLCCFAAFRLVAEICPAGAFVMAVPSDACCCTAFRCAGCMARRTGVRYWGMVLCYHGTRYVRMVLRYRTVVPYCRTVLRRYQCCTGTRYCGTWYGTVGTVALHYDGTVL